MTLESAPGLWRRTEGDGDLPEQYNYVFSIMASLVISLPTEPARGFHFLKNTVFYHGKYTLRLIYSLPSIGLNTFSIMEDVPREENVAR